MSEQPSAYLQHCLDRLREGSYTVSAWFKPEETPKEEDPRNPNFVVVRLPWFALSYFPKSQFLMQHALEGKRFGSRISPEGSSPPGSYYHVARGFAAGLAHRSAAHVERASQYVELAHGPSTR